MPTKPITKWDKIKCFFGFHDWDVSHYGHSGVISCCLVCPVTKDGYPND